jgi:hypothetical protein
MEMKFRRGQRVRVTLVGSAGFGLYGEVMGCDKRGDSVLYAVRCDGEMITRWYTVDEITPVDTDQMHDSGERQEFTTGAVRDTAGDKPRPDLFSPFALERVGRWLGIGAKKYAERNWEKGMPVSRVIASLMRHLLAYMMGKKDEDHMAAVATNAMFILHYEAMIKRGVLHAELNDMPNYGEDNGTAS